MQGHEQNLKNISSSQSVFFSPWKGLRIIWNSSNQVLCDLGNRKILGMLGKYVHFG